LKFHYIAHTALDIVEEKGIALYCLNLLMAGTVATKKSASAAQPDMYLGLLYPMEEYKVYVEPLESHVLVKNFVHSCRYGYITNTKIKLILIVDDTTSEIKEAELRSVWALLCSTAVQRRHSHSTTTHVALQGLPQCLH